MDLIIFTGWREYLISDILCKLGVMDDNYSKSYKDNLEDYNLIIDKLNLFNIKNDTTFKLESINTDEKSYYVLIWNTIEYSNYFHDDGVISTGEIDMDIIIKSVKSFEKFKKLHNLDIMNPRLNYLKDISYIFETALQSSSSDNSDEFNFEDYANFL